ARPYRSLPPRHNGKSSAKPRNVRSSERKSMGAHVLDPTNFRPTIAPCAVRAPGPMKTTGIALALGFSLGAFLACPATAIDKTKFDELLRKYVASSAPFRPKTPASA